MTEKTEKDAVETVTSAGAAEIKNPSVKEFCKGELQRLVKAQAAPC